MKISANELRLGNWVSGTQDYNKYPCPIKILGLGEYTYYVMGRPETDDFGIYTEDGCNQYYPIPLTPEILEKAGFVNKSSLSDWAFELWGIIIGGTRSRLFPSVWGESGLEAYGNEIQYIHQLQNLYFALTGEELDIKL